MIILLLLFCLVALFYAAAIYFLSSRLKSFASNSVVFVALFYANMLVALIFKNDFFQEFKTHLGEWVLIIFSLAYYTLFFRSNLYQKKIRENKYISWLAIFLAILSLLGCVYGIAKLALMDVGVIVNFLNKYILPESISMPFNMVLIKSGN